MKYIIESNNVQIERPFEKPLIMLNGGKLEAVSSPIPRDMEFVDLGLPSGTLWAKYNLGVNVLGKSKREDWFGDFYAWGEVARKNIEDYTWEKYRFATNEQHVYSKYNTAKADAYLDMVDDITTCIAGGAYRLPTKAMVDELWDNNNTTKEIDTNHQGISNLNGIKFISKHNGNFIFIPVNGQIENGVYTERNMASLWTAQLGDINKDKAFALGFTITTSKIYGNVTAINRWFGCNIRPVIPTGAYPEYQE